MHFIVRYPTTRDGCLSRNFSRTPRRSRPALSAFWSVSAKFDANGPIERFRRRARFLLRALGQPRLTRAWLARIVQPDIAPLFAARPRLALKIQRPYVSCAWSPSVRFAALTRHYDLLGQLFVPATREAIYRGGLNLIRLAHPQSGGRWDLHLFYHDRFEKEGELTLAIRDVDSGVMLAGITFCLTQNAGERFAIIGGVQAANDPRTRGLIHDTAKAMFGLRPKALLVWCLQQLAEPWRLTQIQAVGDAQHVWRHWRNRLEIAACYDDFWRECDGRKLSGGGSWELPLNYQTRLRAELKPSRRKTYERRYAMLGALRPRLLEALAAQASGRPADGPRAGGATEFIWPDQGQDLFLLPQGCGLPVTGPNSSVGSLGEKTNLPDTCHAA